uniref:Sulfotransferase domain-containing protein n=1 Tax=Pseudo-nitzschia australis TaxID=44445 RepID=A0A7S4AHG0_9STRA
MAATALASGSGWASNGGIKNNSGHNINSNSNSNSNSKIRMNSNNNSNIMNKNSKTRTKRNNINNNNKKSKGSGSRISLAISVLVLGMVALEYIAYTSLLESNGVGSSMSSSSSSVDFYSSRQMQMQMHTQVERLVTQQQERRNAEKEKEKARMLYGERLKTEQRLKHMDVEEEYKIEELPPWSQILENYNYNSDNSNNNTKNNNNNNNNNNNDEPIILGLEHCPAFRKQHSKQLIGMAPAGLFSTGTNLIASLLSKNCKGPLGRVGNRHKFAMVQVPWGKHNPADARFHHKVPMPVVKDREAVLPVVAIRHPYTWISAMCKHSYNTRWKHDPGRCHITPQLENPVERVPYGFHAYNETHNVTNTYDSLAHMWMEWYRPYFLEHQFNQAPRIMVRHEDMVYRPEKVVSKLCECVGGINRSNTTQDWQAQGGFSYVEDAANKGGGHGSDRSGLLTAIIKYGQPLRHWYDRYNGVDRKIMKRIFQNEPDPDMRAIFHAFNYRLYDNVADPTRQERMATLQRKIREEKQKEQRAENNPEIQKQLEQQREHELELQKARAERIEAKKARAREERLKQYQQNEQQQVQQEKQEIEKPLQTQQKSGKAEKKIASSTGANDASTIKEPVLEKQQQQQQQ